MYDLYKESAINRKYGYFGYGDFYSLITYLTDKGLYGNYILDHYTREEIRELGNYIAPERDYLFNYIGLKTLSDRYLIKRLQRRRAGAAARAVHGRGHASGHEGRRTSWAGPASSTTC